MLKEHSEQLKKAILEANKFRELEKAKKLVAEVCSTTSFIQIISLKYEL